MSSGFTTLRRVAIGGALVTSLAFGFGATVPAFAQDSTPAASPAATAVVVEPQQVTLTLISAEGSVVGVARLSQESPTSEVLITITNASDSGLTPGEHGLHIHEAGICDTKADPAFSTAGGHFNPTGHVHGAPDSADSHAGDLGNLTVNDDGSFLLQTTSTAFTLYAGEPNSLASTTGTSLMIHENVDDLKTDPSGESGGRIACGVIFAPQPGAEMPTSSPAASPQATPVG